MIPTDNIQNQPFALYRIPQPSVYGLHIPLIGHQRLLVIVGTYQ